MPMPDQSQNDPLGAVLGRDPRAQAENDPLREALLAKTIGVIRFRRRLRRCSLAAAMVGCYVAGVVSVGVLRPTVESSPQLAAEQPSPDQRPYRVVSPSPAAAKHQVAAVKPSRFETLRRAADRSLLEQGDVQAALRDYRLALDLASAQQRAIAPGQDTWLLMALKDARSKEQNHVRSEHN
jgi:hypothetical protein